MDTTKKTNKTPISIMFFIFLGAIPFFLGVVIIFSNGAFFELPPLIGGTLIYFYGLIILPFLGGILWGLAMKAGREAEMHLIFLSTLPAIWALCVAAFGIIQGVLYYSECLTFLVFGYLAVLLIDHYFIQEDLVPRWWLKVRVSVTFPVVAMLLIGKSGF